MVSRRQIPFFTDMDVADSVGEAILASGHKLTRLRDVMLGDTADPVVAAACREGGLVLVSHNYRDFRKISKDLEVANGDFDRLSRIEMGCSQVIGAARFVAELSLIELEWAKRLADPEGQGMRIFIGDQIVRVARPPVPKGK